MTDPILEASGMNSRVLSQVEQRGIEPVPDSERNGGPFSLFWVWFAANISILGIPLGATLIALGLNPWQAILAALIGSFGSFAVVGLVSVAGRRGGAPSLTLSRAIFGVRGNMAPTVVALLSRLGWETVNTVTGAFALLSLVNIAVDKDFTAKEVPLLTILAIAVFVLFTITVAGIGHSLILTVQKWATWVYRYWDDRLGHRNRMGHLGRGHVAVPEEVRERYEPYPDGGVWGRHSAGHRDRLG